MIEIGEQLGSPGVQRATQFGDLGDRTAAEVGDQFAGTNAALIEVVGDQAGVQPDAGLGGQPVGTPAQYPADALERVTGAAAVTCGVVLDAAPDIV